MTSASNNAYRYWNIKGTPQIRAMVIYHLGMKHIPSTLDLKGVYSECRRNNNQSRFWSLCHVFYRKELQEPMSDDLSKQNARWASATVFQRKGRWMIKGVMKDAPRGKAESLLWLVKPGPCDHEQFTAASDEGMDAFWRKMDKERIIHLICLSGENSFQDNHISFIHLHKNTFFL